MVHGQHLCLMYIFASALVNVTPQVMPTGTVLSCPHLWGHADTSAGTPLFPDAFQVIGRILKALEKSETEEAEPVWLKTSLPYPRGVNWV